MQSSPTQPSVPAPPPSSPYTTTIPDQVSKKVPPPPIKPTVGKTPFARLLKTLLRPILKSCYYIILWIREHKLVSLIAALLLIISIVATSYFTTGTAPFTSSDTITDTLQENPQLSPDIQDWLIALRHGDLYGMLTIQKSMNPANRPPDSALYVMQFSEKYGNVSWTKASVMSLKRAADGLIDALIEVDMTQKTSEGNATIITLWHFTTLPTGEILAIDYISSRSSS